MTIDGWLKMATTRLTAADIATARLDSQVLLSDVLGKDKSWLAAFGDTTITPELIATLDQQLARREEREPLAYIRGKQDFYGHRFVVTPDVLIPRPETETLVELVLKYSPHGRVLDVGTGSGAIAVSLALTAPHLQIEACDISPEALAIATQNATRLKANVHFFESDLLSNATDMYVGIVANLPYVSRQWEVSPETAAEPELALYADDDGLELIYKLIAQAPGHLLPHGYLYLEADPRQHRAIEKAASEHGFVLVAAKDFGLCFAHGTSI